MGSSIITAERLCPLHTLPPLPPARRPLPGSYWDGLSECWLCFLYAARPRYHITAHMLMQQLPQPSPPGPRPTPTPVAASLGEPCSGRQWSETNYYFNRSDATSRLPITEIRVCVWEGGGRKENLTSLITTSKYKIKVELSRKYIPPPQLA